VNESLRTSICYVHLSPGKMFTRALPSNVLSSFIPHRAYSFAFALSLREENASLDAGAEVLTRQREREVSNFTRELPPSLIRETIVRACVRASDLNRADDKKISARPVFGIKGRA